MAGRMRGDRVEASSSGATSLDAMLAKGVHENPDVDVLATRDDRGVSIMIWNYHDDDIAGPNAPIALSVRGLPAGAQRVLMTHYRIDSSHSNAYSVWKGMGAPQKPTADQQRQLEAAGQLQLVDSPNWLSSQFGKASLNFDLPRQAVSLVRLEW
jgi:xylan 1,4-beta-xylosidase